MTLGPTRSRNVAAFCALILSLSLLSGLAGCSRTTELTSGTSKQLVSPTSQQGQQEPMSGNSQPAEPEPANPSENVAQDPNQDESQEQSESLLLSAADIDLHSVDDWGQYYAFTYGDEVFDVYYEPDTWKVYDSYKITNHGDIEIICQALLDEHPIHGRDLESYRNAEDMAFEWEQHNLAYALLPANSSWLESAMNVDLDPDDQGRTFTEMYASRQLR